MNGVSARGLSKQPEPTWSGYLVVPLTTGVGFMLVKQGRLCEINSWLNKPTMTEIDNIKICTLIASRGLIHSRTIECVLENYKDIESFNNKPEILFTHNMPIPDAQNYLVNEALFTDCTHFWFVEEDNTFPINTLFRLVAERMPVVAVDYPVGEKAYSTLMEKDNEIWWCGLGCTLISREVFEELPEPWFSIDKTWRITNAEKMEMVEEDVPNKYGGHDIYFGMQLRKYGIPITTLKGLTGGHLRLNDDPTRRGTNTGAYDVIEHTEIKNYQRY